MSLLAGALCRLLSEAWLRGCMLVKVRWEEEGMCGQWSQKQGNAYNNTQEVGVVGRRRKKRARKRREQQKGWQWCLEIMGRAGLTLGWALLLGDVNRRYKGPRLRLSFALA